MMEHPVFFSLLLSIQVASIATVFIVFVGVAVAFFLARRVFRGKELLDTLFTLPLVLPPTVTGYYLIVLFGRNGLIGRLLFEWMGCLFRKGLPWANGLIL